MERGEETCRYCAKLPAGEDTGACSPARGSRDRYLNYYNTDRIHHGRLTQGRIPADIVYGARKMEAR